MNGQPSVGEMEVWGVTYLRMQVLPAADILAGK